MIEASSATINFFHFLGNIFNIFGSNINSAIGMVELQFSFWDEKLFHYFSCNFDHLEYNYYEYFLF